MGQTVKDEEDDILDHVFIDVSSVGLGVMRHRALDFGGSWAKNLVSYSSCFPMDGTDGKVRITLSLPNRTFHRWKTVILDNS